MTDIDQIARQLAFLGALKDGIGKLYEQARQDYQRAATAGGTRERARDVLDNNGVELAAITLPKAKTVGVITDERAFLAWVRKHRPEELEQHVRSSFIELVRAWAVQDGGPPGDRETGVLIDGVDAVPSVDTPRVVATRTAKDRAKPIAEMVAGMSERYFQPDLDNQGWLTVAGVLTQEDPQ